MSAGYISLQRSFLNISFTFGARGHIFFAINFFSFFVSKSLSNSQKLLRIRRRKNIGDNKKKNIGQTVVQIFSRSFKALPLPPIYSPLSIGGQRKILPGVVCRRWPQKN